MNSKLALILQIMNKIYLKNKLKCTYKYIIDIQVKLTPKMNKKKLSI